MSDVPPKVVVAGHICLDVIPTFGGEPAEKLFEPGSLTEVGRAVLATGGAVSNVGLALHRLGVPTRMLGKIGDDLFGRAVLDMLREHGPSLADGMIVEEGEATSYTVVLSPPGVDRMFFHAPGANDSFRPADVDVDRLDGARLLHFGYPPLLRRTFADGGAALGELFAAVRARGTAVSLDMTHPDPKSQAGLADWPAFLETVLPQVDVFGPSLGEILFMLGIPDRDAPSLLMEVSDALLKMGVAIVALKLGTNGLFLRTTSDTDRLDGVRGVELGPEWRGRTLLHPCFEVKPAGTTGAGDCTLAGFFAALLKGRSPEECLRDASAVGACGVEREDATSGVPSWEDVQARLRRGWPQRTVGLDLRAWTWSEEDALWVGGPR